MSLQELKAHIIEVVSHSEDEQQLEALSELADQMLIPEQTQELTAYELELARRGRAQIAAGETGNMEDLKTAISKALEEAAAFRGRMQVGNA